MENTEMSIVGRHMGVAPVDLEAIFEELGIELAAEFMDDASGSIVRKGEKFSISVNASNLVYPRLRWKFA